MSDTSREDYEIRCEDACREMVRFMDNVTDVSFEDSQADFWGEDDDGWDWAATMVLKTDIPNPANGKVYCIPVHCQDEVPNVELGCSDTPCGDDKADVYRWLWIEELTSHGNGQ